MNSCRLFGDGKYSSQTEIETEVPESLEQGRPSQGPPAGQSASYASTSGVPATSNLIESGDTIPSLNDIPPLPGSSASGAISSTQIESDRTLIDIPKPDFANVSVHSPRSPAQMLSLDPIKPTGPRMSLTPSGARSSSPGLAKETVVPSAAASGPPLSTVPPVPIEEEIAKAPKAEPAPSSAEPGVPLLHSAHRLSDFYASLNQPLLEQTVVENNPPADPAGTPPPDDSAIPPPPPGSEDFAAPKP